MRLKFKKVCAIFGQIHSYYLWALLFGLGAPREEKKPVYARAQKFVKNHPKNPKFRVLLHFCLTIFKSHRMPRMCMRHAAACTAYMLTGAPDLDRRV